jgi:hypothetical protein
MNQPTKITEEGTEEVTEDERDALERMDGRDKAQEDFEEQAEDGVKVYEV